MGTLKKLNSRLAVHSGKNNVKKYVVNFVTYSLCGLFFQRKKMQVQRKKLSSDWHMSPWLFIVISKELTGKIICLSLSSMLCSQIIY